MVATFEIANGPNQIATASGNNAEEKHPQEDVPRGELKRPANDPPNDFFATLTHSPLRLIESLDAIHNVSMGDRLGNRNHHIRRIRTATIQNYLLVIRNLKTILARFVTMNQD